MAKTLESELARLSRTVRRKVALRRPRGAQPPDAIRRTARDRIALIWEQTGARVLRWLRRI